ncbi:MAG: YceH family protein [Microthrixaceae bacterium]
MTETHDAPPAPSTEALIDPVEARILGCLLEKERTTPAEYPLTANGLMRACNQTTSRHPVVSYDERTVEATLAELKVRGLVRFVHSPSNRATKYRQVVEDAWTLSAAESAVVCLLLLRGPQTGGELRTRAERLHGFDSAEQVESTLRGLAARTPAAVRELERSPGQKEPRWVQLLTGTPSAEDLAAGVAAPRAARGGPDPELLARLDDHDRRIAELEDLVRRLRGVIEDLAGPLDT